MADFAPDDGEKYHKPQHIQEQEARDAAELSLTTASISFIESEIVNYEKLFNDAFDVRNIDVNQPEVDLKAAIKACQVTADQYELRLNYYKDLLASVKPSPDTVTQSLATRLGGGV